MGYFIKNLNKKNVERTQKKGMYFVLKGNRMVSA
jgi:hypothetical protein